MYRWSKIGYELIVETGELSLLLHMFQIVYIKKF